MGWLIAIFVVAMVVGPLMYLRPTNKEKRISTLRLSARKLGLNVKLANLPMLDPEPTQRVSAGGQKKTPERACVAYQLCFSGDEEIKLDRLFLKIPANPTVPITKAFDGWAISPNSQSTNNRIGDGSGSSDEINQTIEKILQSAPDYCIALGIDARFLSCYWLENAPLDGDEVDEINAFLRDAERKISACFAS